MKADGGVRTRSQFGYFGSEVDLFSGEFLHSEIKDEEKGQEEDGELVSLVTDLTI